MSYLNYKNRGYVFEAYRRIENNFALDLRNRAFLSELERLTMFSTVDSLNSASLHTETTSLSFKRRPKSTKNEFRYNYIY
ncbi:hypothetical protein Glove_482g96 [Diversispora epigaea]|uniref:Uncharacterized protein n=1 Tax=Diversispora epigaea TaxID=1348612 RepID=A0A397GLP2_9GLOM|nr:hypothetical protein Glove_482g96 [Diversispora epigaea]